MLRFLQRLIQPELDRLTLELNETRRQRDWFEALFTQASAELKQIDSSHKAEARRFVKREDALVDNVLKLAGAKPVPSRLEPEKVVVEENAVTAPLTDSEQSLLMMRAEEYAQQKYEEPTQDVIADVYRKMLADPAHWLSDQ